MPSPVCAGCSGSEGSRRQTTLQEISWLVKSIAHLKNRVYYVVKLKIYYKEAKSTYHTLVEQETVFKGYGAMNDHQQNAHNYYDKLINDAETTEKICGIHIDSDQEVQMKQGQNVNYLYVKIDCIDEETGDSLYYPTDELDFLFNQESLEDCINEVELYNESAYATEYGLAYPTNNNN